jgi:hypothetical protein
MNVRRRRKKITRKTASGRGKEGPSFGRTN